MPPKAIPNSEKPYRAELASDSIKMAHRTFTDPDGTVWEVWQVTPTSVRNAAGEIRGAVEPGYEHGWLCFENKNGDKRRLLPVPPDWQNLTDARLEALWGQARSVKKKSG
jgi:hypothetical protein